MSPDFPLYFHSLQGAVLALFCRVSNSPGSPHPLHLEGSFVLRALVAGAKFIPLHSATVGVATTGPVWHVMLTCEGAAALAILHSMIGQVGAAQDVSPGGMVAEGMIALSILHRPHHGTEAAMVTVHIAFPGSLPGTFDAGLGPLFHRGSPFAMEGHRAGGKEQGGDKEEKRACHDAR